MLFHTTGRSDYMVIKGVFLVRIESLFLAETIRVIQATDFASVVQTIRLKEDLTPKAVMLQSKPHNETIRSSPSELGALQIDSWTGICTHPSINCTFVMVEIRDR
jgi:hypothetical protein